MPNDIEEVDSIIMGLGFDIRIFQPNSVWGNLPKVDIEPNQGEGQSSVGTITGKREFSWHKDGPYVYCISLNLVF